MSHIQTRAIRMLIAAAAIFTAAGCGDSSGPGEPDDPGILLVPPFAAGYIPDIPIWTKDGTELVYVTGGNVSNSTVLNAVNPSTLAVRQLVAPTNLIMTTARGSAGDWIYFGTANSGISRVHPTSRTVETVTAFGIGGEVLLVSHDERYLVVGRSLFDLQTTGQIDLPSGRAIGFSPDGTQLLYDLDVIGVGGTRAPALISTADGSSQPLHSTGYFTVAHRWEGNSPQLLKVDYSPTGGINTIYRLSEIDGLTGASRNLAEFHAAYFNPFSVSWSPNGQALGVWIEERSAKDGRSRAKLYIIRSGAAPALVASVGPGVTTGPPIFSPSGNALVYIHYYNDGRSLYLKSGI